MRIGSVPIAAIRPKGSAVVQPFSDSFTRADGAIGNGWTGTTWTISGNAAVNTPVLPTTGGPLNDGEQLTDPGLEANYTAGVCDSFAAKAGSPTVSEETSDVHGGSSAQAFQAAAYNDSLRMLRSPNSWTLGTWVRGGAWAKRVSGTDAGTGIELRSTSWTHTKVPITSAAWAQYIAHARCTSTNSMSLYTPLKAGTGAGSPVLIDDDSLKILPFNQLITTHPTGIGTVYTASVNITIPSLLTTYIMTLGGLILNANDPTNPTTFVIAHIDAMPAANNCRVRLERCVNGMYSTLVDTNDNSTYAAGGTLTVKRNGSTFQIFYRGTQMGTDQTIANAGSATNHGLFSLHENASFANFSITPSIA